MKDGCSLLISTYNWPSALQLCLKSVMQQSVMPNEVIIADDGSRNDTKSLIESFKEQSSVPIVHVWHADDGFQLSKIRNRAIAKASYSYIIQIDGDLILHQQFIKDHLHVKQKGCFVTGSRVLLSPQTSKALLENNSLDIKRYNSGTKNHLNKFRNRLLRHYLATRYKTKGKHTYYVKGCNMAFWKEDLITVNGYNEALIGWGREDSELAVRLLNAMVQKKFLKMGGITFHIHHKEACRSMESRNVQMLEMAISEKRTRAEIGLNQYLES
jgi:glycosyltransferase involved in cell wall biosynthesis